MKILAIDSTAVVSSVAVCEDEKLLSEYTINNGNTHSQTLLPMIENMLASLGLGVDGIDIFAISEGPGSFTGVRIGAATVKGLAFGKGKTCVGVSTLDALAQNLCGIKGIICPVMNARRSQLYCAIFASDGEKLTRLMPDSAISVTELCEILKRDHPSAPIYFCGDGYEIARAGIILPNIENTPALLRNQSAYSVARVALAKYESEKDNTDFSDSALSPTYLRLSQAERERLEKLGNPPV